MAKSHTLSGQDLKSLLLQALQQGKEALYLVHFLDAGVTAEIRLSTERPDRW